MITKLFKLSLAVLAGVVLLAPSCIKIETVMEKVDEKYAWLPGQVASLEQQLAALQTTLTTSYETIEKHKNDADGLRDDISKLYSLKLDKSTYDTFQTSAAEAQKLLSDLKYADKDWVEQIIRLLSDLCDMTPQEWKDAGEAYVTVREYIEGEIARLEHRLEAVETALRELTKEGGIIDSIKESIEKLQSGKVDKDDFDTYKEEIAQTLSDIEKAAEAIIALSEAVPGDMTLVQYIEQVTSQLGDYVLASTFNEFCALAATKGELSAVKAELEGRIKVLEDLLSGDWGGMTVQEFVRAELSNLNLVFPELDQQVLPQLLQDIQDLKDFKLDKAEFNAYKEATALTLQQLQQAINQLMGLCADIPEGSTIKQYLYDNLSAVYDMLSTRITKVENLLAGDWHGMTVQQYINSKIASIQSIVFVPAWEDGLLTLSSSGNSLNTFKIMPVDAAKTLVDLFATDPDAFHFEVKTVATRASSQEVVALQLSAATVQLNSANIDKGWVDFYMTSNYGTLSSTDKSKSYFAALVIDIPASDTHAAFSISSPFYGIHMP